MLDGMSDSIQRSRIENLHSREVDRQSPTGLIFITGVTFDFNFLVIALFFSRITSGQTRSQRRTFVDCWSRVCVAWMAFLFST